MHWKDKQMRLHKNVAKGPEKGPKSSKKKKGPHTRGGAKTLRKTVTGGKQEGLGGFCLLVCMLKEALLCGQKLLGRESK